MPHVSTDIQERYDTFKAKGLALDLTRGKPSAAQLDLSNELLSLPGADYVSEGATDCRNYGGLQGLVEARRLFSGVMDAPPEQVVVSTNSSLALMHDTIVYSLLKGTCDSEEPWSAQGGDRVRVPGAGGRSPLQDLRGLRDPDDSGAPSRRRAGHGPGRAARGAGSVDQGHLVRPRYSNPTGSVYSDDKVGRLAAMRAAAPDFRVYWDNAYAVHHLTDERIAIANILALSARHGNPNRPLVFASTSKITLAGSGLALFAGSKANVAWLLARLTPRTIGPDKINQWRHVRFLHDEEGILRLMDRHRALIAPKFQKVQQVFEENLADLPNVSWTKPKGGYFISLTVPSGCAKRMVALAKDAGIALTPAGAPYPHGKDPDDRTIRIAPTFPELAEVDQAAKGVAVCVQLAVAQSATAAW